MIDCTNIEAETISAIERLAFLVRQARRKIEHARTQPDRRAINSQIEEMLGQIEMFRRRLNETGLRRHPAGVTSPFQHAKAADDGPIAS